MKHATYSDVLQAISEGRLRIAEDGTIEGKRFDKKAKWRTRTLEPVSPPGRKAFYHRIRFSTSAGSFRCLAHRVIWFALRGDIPQGFTVNHRNGKKTDNRIENLEVVTMVENMAHAIATGLHDPHCPKNWSLDEVTVRKVRSLAKTESQRSIARGLGISHNVVSRILTGKTYRSVK